MILLILVYTLKNCKCLRLEQNQMWPFFIIHGRVLHYVFYCPNTDQMA